jgi:hypothetical protein
LIPRAYLQEWSAKAPWPDLRQVEQDLIICRALCDLFNSPKLKGRIAFRGGTAIHKLLFRRPLRYSQDIDLVQVRPERIGPTIDAVREALEWLGDCPSRYRVIRAGGAFRGMASTPARSLRALSTAWTWRDIRSRAPKPSSGCWRSSPAA